MKTVMVHTSDFHGELPAAIPACDILTISGDLCNNYSKNPETELFAQSAWLRGSLGPWLRSQPVGMTLATWGNHDGIGYLAPHYVSCEVPVMWLVDRLKYFRGFSFYGTPWTHQFGNHCYFMCENDERLAAKFAGIPPCDVLLSHGPPLGYGDLAPGEPTFGIGAPLVHTGSQALLDRIEQVRPKLTVFGHIHPANGLYKHNELLLANVAIVDKEYRPVQKMLRTVWENHTLVDMEPV